ncbi:MAG: magnesium transporter [bacterium]
MNAQPDLASELETWLELDRPEALAARASELHPADLAAALTQLEAEGQTALLERLPSEIAASILAELDPLACRHVVCDLGEPSLSILLEEMSPQAAVSMLEPLPVEARERVIAALSPSMRSEVEQRLLHPEDSAGRIMTTEVPSVAWEGNVAQAIESLRRRFGDRSAIDTIFVIDDAERLQGRVSPLRLLLADPDQPLQELVDREVLSVPPDMDQERVADLAVRYDLVAVPVVDERERLIGRVSFDDVFDVIHEEESEDISYLAGTGTDAPTDRTASRAIRARLPWLCLGLVGGLGSALVLSRFEASLERLVSLAFFVPAVLGLAGAVAVQSSSLAVRGLATGSLAPRQLPVVAWRELRVSVGMGLALGALLGLAAFISSGGDHRLAGLLFVVLVLVLVAAAIGGTLMPLALEKLGVDPAMAMGPFVTTLTDLAALAIYMGIASLVIG